LAARAAVLAFGDELLAPPPPAPRRDQVQPP